MNPPTVLESLLVVSSVQRDGCKHSELLDPITGRVFTRVYPTSGKYSDSPYHLIASLPLSVHLFLCIHSNPIITLTGHSMGTAPSKQAPLPHVESVDEKRAISTTAAETRVIDARHHTEMGQSLTPDALDEWSKNFDRVSPHSDNAHTSTQS